MVLKKIRARQIVVLKEIHAVQLSSTKFERASEIFLCKPNKYGSFWKIMLVEFVLVELVQAEDPLNYVLEYEGHCMPLPLTYDPTAYFQFSVSQMETLWFRLDTIYLMHFYSKRGEKKIGA